MPANWDRNAGVYFTSQTIGRLRIDRQRDRPECLADQLLEFGSALVREMLVVGIDPVDVLVMGDDPVTLRRSAGGRRVEQQPRNILAVEPPALLSSLYIRNACPPLDALARRF